MRTGAEPAATAADPWTPAGPVPAPELLYDRFESFGVADGLPTERVTSVLAEGEDLSVGTEHGLTPAPHAA